MTSLPPPSPYSGISPPIEPSAPIGGLGNPYAGLVPLDLSEATFEKVADIDPSRMQEVLDEVAALSQSNLANKAKWNTYLRILETTLRSVGYVVRIAAVA